MAANGTVDLVFPGGSESHGGNPVFVEGETYKLEIRYDKNVPASHVAVVSVPEGFTITDVPKDNAAVKRFELSADGKLTIEFNDKVTWNNGSIDLFMRVDARETSTIENISWGVNGQESSQTIIFKEKSDQFVNLENRGWKDVWDVTYPAVTVDKDGKVVLDEKTFLGKTVSYAVTVTNKDKAEVVIADTLASGMTLVPDSFSMTKVVSDKDGMNKVGPTAVDMAASQYVGTSFSHTITPEPNSTYTLYYKAKIADAAALDEYRKALQEQYELAKGEEDKPFSIELKNTATVDGSADSKSFWIGGKTDKVKRPGIGQAFGKSSSLTGTTTVEFAEDGKTLVPALPLTYKFKVNLKEFEDFVGTEFELKRNVVITDVLPKNFEWVTGGDTPFISGGYTPAVGATEDTFANEEFVRKYWLDGQTLRINVGRDVTRNETISVQAQLVSVENAAVNGKPSDPYLSAEYSNMKNTAEFKYSDSDPHKASVDTKVGTETEPGETINDGNKFNKTSSGEPIVLEDGQTVTKIPFTFAVGAGIGDARDSAIVDRIDHSVLDVTDKTLAEIKKSISGKYDDKQPLDASMFDVKIDGDKNLVFTPNSSFPVSGSGEADGKFTFTVEIPTKPIEGNSAITVTNKATYKGEKNKYNFTSSTTSSAGVAGREIAVKKDVLNAATGEFTTNLRAELDDKGDLVNDEFIYRIRFMPTLDYKTMLYDIDDDLVENLEFVGFVNPDQVKQDGTTAGKGNYRIPGTELNVTFDEGKNQISVAAGQPIQGGKTVELFFKVKIKTFTDGEGVENAIGPEKVTITPTNDLPLDISKIDESNPLADPITDRDARFELRNAAGEVVLNDLYIVGGKLRMAAEKNGKKYDAVPTVKEVGTYTIHELKAPAGFVKAKDPVVLVVKEDGTSQETKFFNTPRDAVKKVSVGDYVWLDKNRDGIQDAGEAPIQGVKLVLTGPDGKVVTDIDGNEVKPTVTDANGFYEFIDLPALAKGETYTVSIDRKDEGTQKALEGLIPTKEKGTDDREKDSSTWTAVSRDDLVNDGDRDSSLDFGFHSKSVSVGDYVWLDIDGDGVQGTDPSEKPIAGVKLVLTGPDGKPVTDVFGNLVEPTVTNDKGRYTFDNLPALKEGETYTVSIDREDKGTQKALEGLVPTKTKGTDDRELDSSEWTAISRDDLVKDGDRDPSLDFGFRSKSVSVGDYVWLDVDGDGVQGTSPDEKPIEGVKLVITGPDGKPVVDVFGNEVQPVVTDKKGFYEFVNLPALKEGETYTVSIDREDEGTQKALEGLLPTKTEGTENTELDSSEWTAVSRDNLVNDGDRDPSLDFGFKYKTYAVGDVVWIDANKDGLQGDDESTLKDVIVRLFDEQGNLVATTKTNDKGLYVFDELRAGKYRVQFELTPAQAKLYSFTKLGGGDIALDSNAGDKGFSTWFVLDDSNADLTLDYAHADVFGGIKATQGIDPTWDAGVIVNDPVTVPGTGTPEHPEGSTTIGELPTTGGSISWGIAAGGAAMLLLGAGALLMTRRRRGQHA